MTADDIKALVERLMTATYTTSAIRREAAEAITALLRDIEGLKHDNTSMLDSLTKESTARCEAEDALAALTLENQRLRVDAELLSQVASCKRADPNGKKPWNIDKRWITVNVPGELMDKIDAARSQSDKEKP
jgi:hypothetical protein